jgi:hypothetical protein
LQLGLEFFPIAGCETRKPIDLLDEQDVTVVCSASSLNSSGRASLAPDSFSVYQATI